MPATDGVLRAFFSTVVVDLLVRHGDDAQLPLHFERVRDADGQEVEITRSTHNFANVYREMLLQICSEYPALGDFRVLTDAEIRFFYDGLRGRLKHITKPR